MIRSNPFQCIVVLSMSLFLGACGGSSSSTDSEASVESNSDSNTDTTSDNSSGPGCAITSDEQEMLNQVNQARSSRRSCGSDNMPAVDALTWSCLLKDAAQRHSSDMVENNFVSHTGSDGLNVGRRVTAAGYVWRGVGENIAAGQTTITRVMTGWLNSPGHCRNIMAAGFTEFGSSLVLRNQENSNSTYTHYWTQVFATVR